jgi:Uma2 family endonuclease
MVSPASSYVTYEDFLDAERASDVKREWLDGVVYAMAGGALEHSRLAGNVHAALENGLAPARCFSRTRCSTFARASCLPTPTSRS